MATPTALDKGYLGAAQTTYSTGAVSVSDGEVALIWFFSDPGVEPTSVEFSGGAAFTRVDSQDDGAGTTRGRLHLYRAVPGAISSETIDVTFASDGSFFGWLAESWTGLDTSGPIVQSVTVQSGGQATSAGVTLAAFASTDNRPAGGIFVSQRSENVTPGVDFTEIQEQQSGGSKTLMNEWRDAEDVNPDFSWSSSSHYAIIGVELAAETSKPATPNTPTETVGENGEKPVSIPEILSGPDQMSGIEWVESSATAGEWYAQATGGGAPPITIPEPRGAIYIDGSFSVQGTVGSLGIEEHAFADNDSLGFTTLYVEQASDPDTSGVEIASLLAIEYVEVTGIDNTTGNDLRLEYQITGAGTWDASKTVAITGTTMTVTVPNLPSDRGIDYRAVVVNTDESPAVESDPSASVTLRSAPEPPTQGGVTVTNGIPTLTWQSNSAQQYGFAIYDESGNRGLLVITDPEDESWTDDNAPSGEKEYSVQAWNETDDKYSGPLTIDTTLQPDTPTLTVENIGDTVATLVGSAFNDPGGDAHLASQWQVTTDADTGFSSPVIDTGDDTSNLTEYLATGLTASTDYRARVRYKDDSGDGSTEWSEWSDAETFSTTAEAITGTASIVAIGGTAILVGEAS